MLRHTTLKNVADALKTQCKIPALLIPTDIQHEVTANIKANSYYFDHDGSRHRYNKYENAVLAYERAIYKTLCIVNRKEPNSPPWILAIGVKNGDRSNLSKPWEYNLAMHPQHDLPAVPLFFHSYEEANTFYQELPRTFQECVGIVRLGHHHRSFEPIYPVNSGKGSSH